MRHIEKVQPFDMTHFAILYITFYFLVFADFTDEKLPSAFTPFVDV